MKTEVGNLSLLSADPIDYGGSHLIKFLSFHYDGLYIIPIRANKAVHVAALVSLVKQRTECSVSFDVIL